MRKIIVGLLTILTVGIFSAIVCAENVSEKPADPPKKMMSEQKAEKVKAAEPAQSFKSARENFIKKDLKLSADEIRKGGAFLKKETESAAMEGKKGLTVSAEELDKLADAVEKGTVNSVKELDEAFARAHHALAMNHHLKASEAIKRNDLKAAAHHSRAAAANFEHAMPTTGEMEKGSK